MLNYRGTACKLSGTPTVAGMMENYKLSDKDFFDGYKSSRVIRDLGIRHRDGGIGILQAGNPGSPGSTGSPGNFGRIGENNPPAAGLLASGDSGESDS